MKIQFKASVPASTPLASILDKKSSTSSPTERIKLNFTITHVLKDSITPIRLSDVLLLNELYLIYVPINTLISEQPSSTDVGGTNDTIALSNLLRNKNLYLYMTNPITKKNKFAVLLPVIQENYYQLAIVPNNEKFKALCYNSYLISLQNFFSINSSKSPQNEEIRYFNGFESYEDLIHKVSISDTITPIPLSSEIEFSMTRPLPSISSNFYTTPTDEIIKDIDPIEFLKDRYTNTLYNNTIQFQVFSKTALPRLYLLSRSNQKLVLTTLVDFLIFNISQFDSFYKTDNLANNFNKLNNTINKTDISDFKEYFSKNHIDLSLGTLENNERFNDLIQDLKAREARLQVLLCLEILSILIADPDLQDTDSTDGNTLDKLSLSQRRDGLLIRPIVKRQLIGRKKKRLTPTLIGNAIPDDLKFTTDLRDNNGGNSNDKSKPNTEDVLAINPVTNDILETATKPSISIPSIRNLLDSYFERICLYEAIKGTNVKDKDSSFNFILVSIIPYFQNRVNNRIIKELVNKARGPSLTAKKRHEKKSKSRHHSKSSSNDLLSSSHSFSQSQSQKSFRAKRSDSTGSLSSFPYNDIFSDTQLNNSQVSLISSKSQNESSNIIEKEGLLSMSGAKKNKIHRNHHQSISLKRTTSNLDKKSFDMISNTSFTSLVSQANPVPVSESASEERSFFKKKEKRVLKPSKSTLTSITNTQGKTEEKGYVTQIEATPMKQKSSLLVEESPIIYYSKRTEDEGSQRNHDLIKIPNSPRRRTYHKKANDASPEILIDSSPFNKPGISTQIITEEHDQSLLLSPLNLRHPYSTSALTTNAINQKGEERQPPSKYTDNLVLSSPISSKKTFETPLKSSKTSNPRSATKRKLDLEDQRQTFDKLTTPIFKRIKRPSLTGSNTKPGEFILPQSSPFYEHNINGGDNGNANTVVERTDEKVVTSAEKLDKINRKLQFD